MLTTGLFTALLLCIALRSTDMPYVAHQAATTASTTARAHGEGIAQDFRRGEGEGVPRRRRLEERVEGVTKRSEDREQSWMVWKEGRKEEA